VADAKLAPQLAEIGVILLMFGIGMHFSVSDLLAVRNIAVPGALVQVAATVALTCGVARLWGWSLGASLVLGLALSVASTVVPVARPGSARHSRVGKWPDRSWLAHCRGPRYRLNSRAPAGLGCVPRRTADR
jgi:uncharacterized membrane protein AbrB (regulator of aidB expression)